MWVGCQGLLVFLHAFDERTDEQPGAGEDNQRQSDDERRDHADVHDHLDGRAGKHDQVERFAFLPRHGVTHR